MRRLLTKILSKPLLWLVGKTSSKPIPSRIFNCLSKIRRDTNRKKPQKGARLVANIDESKVIVFSDQHRGAKNGADDFMQCETTYLSALQYYNEQEFCLISLGDNEELWENRWTSVKEKNIASFEAEKKFVFRNAFVKVYGNHDLSWSINPFMRMEMEKIYGRKIKVYESVLLELLANHKKLSVLLTHGHQGDKKSDGNWFSKFFVANVWAPLQSYMKINPNTPAYNSTRKTLHNRIMYEWSATQKNLLLITGHTHQPVFESLTELERLYKKLLLAEVEKNQQQIDDIRERLKKVEPNFTSVSKDYLEMKPSYFNSGCCCFSDGDISGIEISGGFIRLIKWSHAENVSKRYVLEERSLHELLEIL
jgi:predicted phosphodiesterase